MAIRIRRREFIATLGGAAVAWPFAARAQQPKVRRIGVLMNTVSDDAEGQARLAAFHQGLQQLDWTVGHNVRIDYRWGSGDAERGRRGAAELVALGSDVILASGTPSVAALRQATDRIPVVFALVGDPVGAGFVESLARPGGNMTGFTAAFEFGVSAKWLELLKEVAPGVTRVAVLRDLTIGIAQLAAIQAVAPALGVELTPIGLSAAGEIERGVTAFARGSTDGMIVPASTLALAHRELIATVAARHRLPAVYGWRYMVTAGDLLSYGPNSVDPFRRAAGYVDRILKGEKPADLPVQAPTKHELVINLKTARAIGIEIPPTLLARADEVIE
jgi:putative ABC transport system substrate-binding protein